MTVRVLIVDPHKLVAAALGDMVGRNDGIEVVGIVGTGDRAVEIVGREDIDIVVTEVTLGSAMNGIEATRRIKACMPRVRVLILTMFTDLIAVTEAVRAGADGYLTKHASSDRVVKAIQDVMEGQSVLDPSVTGGILRRVRGQDVTECELLILQKLAEGRTTREIAGEMSVAEATIKFYLKQTFRKLGVRNRTEAVSEAFRRDLIH